MRLTKPIGMTILLLFAIIFLQAQTTYITDSLSLAEHEPVLPDNYFDKVQQKFSNVTGKLNKQTIKAIRKFKKQEAKLQKLLAKKDSATTAAIFNGTADYLLNLQQQFVSVGDKAINKLQGEYNAYLDTLKTTFKFLEKAGGQGNAATAKLQAAMSKVNGLEGKFLKAEEIKKYLRERKELLKQQLQRFGLGKKIKQLDKSVYYYSQYVKEFKETIKDPKRIEEKALALLRKSGIYKKFVAENSLLASLFKLPGSGDDAGMVQSLAGLQTRQTVGAIIADRVGSGGPNAINAVRQQIQSGMQQLNAIKDKMAQYGSADADIPSFKPSEYKTKPLLKRIGFETNLQFGKANQLMPTAADLGLGIHYKTKFGIIGVGASYKMGLGSGWRDIRLSSNGAGLRSYLDIKLKKQLFISGGYEQNYYNSFRSFAQLKESTVWQSSGLLGISRKVTGKGKKSAKLSILWDFLSYQHRPVSQPVIVRFGYTLK
jgi:hypothetical protein